MKLNILGIVVLAGIIGALLYLGSQRPQENKPEGIQVMASFYPLAEFASQVGGNVVQVSTVVPPGVEPHEYEPTPQQLAAVYNSQVFIYNGSGVDPWAERIAPELQQQGVVVINMSDVVQLQTASVVEGEDPEGPYDPHFWLDPVLAQKQIAVIGEALITIDPNNASLYVMQTDAYIAQLKSLDQQYRVGLQVCARRDFVTSHAAFGYLAKEYNLSAINISGISSEEEPSALALSMVAKTAKEKNIRYIFFETLVSPKLAEVVASEIGAQTLVFNPLEGLSEEDQQAGKNYISVMQDNLQNLRIALECR